MSTAPRLVTAYTREDATDVANQQMKVYADTSGFGSVFDSEFSDPSREFFDDVDARRFALVISSVVVSELQPAPLEVWRFFARYAEEAQVLEISDEALELQSNHIRFGVVTERSVEDALHVALATVSGCDLIVSWNFKDIVHFHKIRKYNAVNMFYGRGQLGIYSPLEVIQHDNPRT